MNTSSTPWLKFAGKIRRHGFESVDAKIARNQRKMIARPVGADFRSPVRFTKYTTVNATAATMNRQWIVSVNRKRVP